MFWFLLLLGFLHSIKSLMMIFWSKKFGDFYYEREIWNFSCIIQVINRQWIMSLNYCIIFFFFMLNLLNCWTLEIENANSMANNVRVVGCDWFKFLQIFLLVIVFFSLILIKSSSVGSLYSTIDLDFNYMFFFIIANLREKYVIFYTFSHSHYFFFSIDFLVSLERQHMEQHSKISKIHLILLLVLTFLLILCFLHFR